jgi:hypothetical protein
VGKGISQDPRLKEKKKENRYDKIAYIEEIGDDDSHLYRLRWGKEGGYTKRDKPNRLSDKWWHAADLKAYWKRADIRSIRNGM